MITQVTNLIYFFLFVIIGSLWCWGIHAFFQLSGLEKFAHFALFLRKPLFDCPPCMGSIHGTMIYLLFMVHEIGILFWPIYCICLCGLNYIIKEHLYE